MVRADGYQRGVDLFENGAIDEATELLDAFVADHPKHAGATFVLGLCYFRLERYERAEVLFRTALSLKPHDANAHYYLGLSLERQLLLEEAKAQFRETLRYDPSYDLAREKLVALGEDPAVEAAYREKRAAKKRVPRRKNPRTIVGFLWAATRWLFLLALGGVLGAGVALAVGLGPEIAIFTGLLGVVVSQAVQASRTKRQV